MNKSMFGVWVGVFGAILFTLGLFTRFFVLGLIIDVQFQREMVLNNDTQFYKHWTESKDLNLKVYFYNVTNPAEIVQGATPILDEVGPFVFRQNIYKMDVAELDEDTIQYRQNYTSHFLQSASGGRRDTDQVTIIDLALMGVIVGLENAASAQMDRVATAVDLLFSNRTSPFLTSSVRDIMFTGTPIDCSARQMLAFFVCRALQRAAPQIFWMNDNRVFKYAFLRDRNASFPEIYTVSRGSKNFRNRGMLKAINNSTSIQYWGSEYCNMINGTTDGSFFTPFLKHSDTIYYYEPQMHRSLHAKFVRNVEVAGLKCLRFEMKPEIFNSVENNPENACYCGKGLLEEEDGSVAMFCPPDGYMNLARVFFAPLYLSSARSLFTKENLSEILREYSELHFDDIVSSVVVEPLTGSVIKASKRIQFNIEMRPVSVFPYLKKVTGRIIPAFWLDLDYEIDDAGLEDLRSILYKMEAGELALNVVIAVGCALLIAGVAIYVHVKIRTNTKVKVQQMLGKDVFNVRGTAGISAALYEPRIEIKRRKLSAAAVQYPPLSSSYQEHFM